MDGVDARNSSSPHRYIYIYIDPFVHLSIHSLIHSFTHPFSLLYDSSTHVTHHITSHHFTSHHIASHHIGSHRIKSHLTITNSPFQATETFAPATAALVSECGSAATTVTAAGKCAKVPSFAFVYSSPLLHIHSLDVIR